MSIKMQSLVCMLLFILSMILICVTAKPAAATSLRAFEADSLEKIQAVCSGRPFPPVLWSLDCPHGRKELNLPAR